MNFFHTVPVCGKVSAVGFQLKGLKQTIRATKSIVLLFLNIILQLHRQTFLKYLEIETLDNTAQSH